MKQWYYAQNNQQHGPISEPLLVSLFESGQLAPDTLVWTEGLKDWAVARDVEGLIPLAYTPPVLSHTSVTIGTEHGPSGEQVRPWVRYWARMFDFFLFAFLGGATLGVVYPPIIEIPEILFSILLLFAYAFVEPAMLAGWGTTPGKALLKIRLRNSDGSKLSYTDALSRSFDVFFKGVGIGIPIVQLITLIFAYNRLTKKGITSWDEGGNFKVSHQAIEAWRSIVAVFIFMAFLYLMVLGEADI